MANTSLTATELFGLVKDIIELVSKSANHRVDLVQAGKLDLAHSRNINGLEGRLLNLANELTNVAIDKTIRTDLSGAAQVLKKTTGDLTAVINQLNDFNNFVGTLANLINIFSRISQAIAGGTTAVISTLVEGIKNLANTMASPSGNIFVTEDTNSGTDNASVRAGNINEI